MTALDERPAVLDLPEPDGITLYCPRPVAPGDWRRQNPLDSGFWVEPWCPPHCVGHADNSTLHYHATDLEHFGEFGITVACETGRLAFVAICDLPTPQTNLDDEQADRFADQLKRASRLVKRINNPVRLTDDAVVTELLGLLRGPQDDDALFAAYDDLAAVIGRERLDALDDTASQVYLDEKRAAAQTPQTPEFVHWARQNPPLGDPAQCGSPTGRATRVASAVTCPACKSWMANEAWSAVAA